MIEFQPWPSISRLNRDCVITEKLDGTNSAIMFYQEEGSEFYSTYVQSRKRFITISDDNFGFARWVFDNETTLWNVLGPGSHFGEWWGSGIQRGYGLPKGEKRFSLFNTPRWRDIELPNDIGLYMVPELFVGHFTTSNIELAKADLCNKGSKAAPGFSRPEGVVVFHTAARTAYKSTFDECDEYGFNGGKSGKFN